MLPIKISKLEIDINTLRNKILEYANGERGFLLAHDAEFTRIWASYSEIRNQLINLDQNMFSTLRDVVQPEPDLEGINPPLKGYSEGLLQPLIDELNIAIEYLGAYKEQSTPPATITPPIDKLKLLCLKIHLVARELCKRRENRNTLSIKDEYDLQDLFRALLYIFFDDVREEEWTPSYAGGSSRLDFLLKNENIILELKKTRKGLNARQLGEQLIIDIEKYKTHPNCKYIFCFAYDPDGIINNPIGIENDLSKVHGDISVHLLIEPK